MPSFKQAPIEGILYFLHRKGHSPLAAHLELQKTIEEDVMGLEDVQEFFEKIKSGEYDLKEPTDDEKQTRMAEALRQNQVHTRVLENLDMKSKLTLLKTNSQLRLLSMETKLHINQLTIQFTTDYVRMFTDNGYHTVFLIFESEVNDDPLIISNVHRKIGSELKKIFQFKSLTIGTFCIQQMCHDYRWLMDRHNYDLRNTIESSLVGRKKPLKVGKLVTNCEGSDYLNFLLRYVEPVYLKAIRLEAQNNPHNDASFLDLNVFETLSWKSCTSLISDQKILLDRSAKDFSHFQLCKINCIYKVLAETVLQLKEALLGNTALRQFKIKTTLLENDIDELNSALNIVNPPDTRNIPIWTQFDYPDGSGSKLSVCVTKKMIWFKGPQYVEGEDEDDEEELDEVEERNLAAVEEEHENEID